VVDDGNAKQRLHRRVIRGKTDGARVLVEVFKAE
jgi:hypothetical protein